MNEKHLTAASDNELLEKLATYGEIADETGLPLGSLYSLVAQNRIPHIRIGRRCVRFSRKQVRGWLDSHTIVHGAAR